MTYLEDFTLAERLADVLVWAVVTGRLTDEEEELVEASVTAEAQQRHQDAERVAEYHHWLAETERRHREEQRLQAEAHRERDDLFYGWHCYLELMDLAGSLPGPEVLSFVQWCERNPSPARAAPSSKPGQIPSIVDLVESMEASR